VTQGVEEGRDYDIMQGTLATASTCYTGITYSCWNDYSANSCMTAE